MTDAERLWALHRAFLAANQTGDTDFLRAHVDANVVWYNLNQSVYLGLASIIDLWDMLRAVSAGKPATIQARDEQLTLTDDLAVLTYLFTFAADFGALGKFSQDARNTEIWQRSDSAWKLLHFHSSNHTPDIMGGQ